MSNSSLKSKKAVYCITLVMAIVMMCIFMNSFYWPYKDISKRKIIVGTTVIFCVLLFPVLVVRVRRFYKFAVMVLERIADSINKFKENRRRISLYCVIAIVGVGLLHLVTYILSEYVLQTTYNVRLLYMFVVLFVIGLFYSFAWKNAAQKVEKVFFVTAVSLGLFCIGVTPSRVGISWDDEIHYARTLEISNVFNGIMYEADTKNITDYANNIYGRNGYDRLTDSQYQDELEASYKAKEWNLHEFSDYDVWSVAYIPSVIGIILGRGLDLSYASVFNLGRLCNLLTYSLLISLAIKRMKYGKVLIATIGLIPTTIFMASCYSYDWWVTGFTILGFSYFFAELQDEKPLKNKNIMIMIGAIALGCLPKATYFPMLFPLLFMPKKKFVNEKQRKYYYLTIIGTGVLLVSTFILPMLINGAGGGDVRGGSDVNSTEQIKYILNNPLSYIETLIEFELDYVALANSASMLQRFAYVGNGYFYSVVGLILFALAFLDRGKHENNHYIVKGASLIACVITIILSTTALYISFTAVGSHTVAGMQARYLIPTIFPALYSLGIGGTTHKINQNAFVCVPMLIISLTFIANMFRFCVLCY